MSNSKTTGHIGISARLVAAVSLTRRSEYRHAQFCSALILALSVATPVKSQSISFVEIADPNLPASFQAGRHEAFERARRLSNAVIRARLWVDAGKRLDFAVIYGLGTPSLGAEESRGWTMDRVHALAALPVPRIAVVPSPHDLGPNNIHRSRFEKYLKLLQEAASGTEIVDLSRAVFMIREVALVGIDPTAFDPNGTEPTGEESRADQRMTEVKRIDEVLQRSHPTVIFSYLLDLDGTDDPTGRWVCDARATQAFGELVDKPNVLGVFGAPANLEGWVNYGIPSACSSSVQKRVWRPPTIGGAESDVPGIRFLTIPADGGIRPVAVVLAEPSEEALDAAVANLTTGDAFAAAEDYESAIGAYKNAMSSRDPLISAAAGRRLTNAVRAKAQADYWPTIVLLPWLVQRGPEWAVLIVLPLVVVWYVRRKKVQEAKKMGSRRHQRWILRLLQKPTPEFRTDLIVHGFRLAAVELDQLSAMLSGGSTLKQFSTGPEVSTPSCPKIGEIIVSGVKLHELLLTVFRILQYFSWNLEITAGQTDGQVSIHASLRWGGRVAQQWHVPVPHARPLKTPESAGRVLAYEVLSTNWIRT